MILLRYSAEIVVLLTNVTKHNKPTQLTANGHKYEESKYFLFLLTNICAVYLKAYSFLHRSGRSWVWVFFRFFFDIISNQTKGVFGPLFFSSECAAVHVKQCAQEFIVAVNSIQKIFLCKYFGFQIGYCDEHRKCDEHIRNENTNANHSENHFDACPCIIYNCCLFAIRPTYTTVLKQKLQSVA